jgi:hypothetical protein
MIGYGVFFVAMLVMKLTPQSPLGRWLNLHLVELPLRNFDYRRIFWLALFVALAFATSDVLPLVGGTDFLTVYAWDLTVYFDAMVVAYALATVARARAGVRWLALRASLLLLWRGPRSRARRTRPARKLRDRVSNDDDPAPAWSLAA